MKVVVIIPTYNERDNVGATAKEVVKAFRSMNGHDSHILFVDDSSPDGTATEINRLIKTNKNLHVLINKRKGGLGKAYKKGMLYALDRLKADVVFEFDADLSHDPAKIPAMVQAIEQGADLVLGSRYVKGGGIPDNWGAHRKLLSIAGNLTARLILTNFAIKDWTTGYRALRSELVRDVIPKLNSKRFSGYTWQIGFLHNAVKGGYKVVEVPFHFRDRTLGKSKLGPEYIINTLMYLLRTRITDLLQLRIFKFAVVGGIGSLVQLTALTVYRFFIKGSVWLFSPYQIALAASIETAIVSNFLFSNLWTFADRRLPLSKYPAKFVQFNLSSLGAVLIQFVIASLGERFIGLYPLFVLPISGFVIDTGLVFAVVGILVGMFWNFFAYNRFIWKKK